MLKKINLFLIFILFFNFVFCIDNGYASSTYGVSGLNPRIRHYKEIRFIYSAYDGFDCDVSALKTFAGDTKLSVDSIDFNNIGFATLQILIDSIVFPLQCFFGTAAIYSGVKERFKNKEYKKSSSQKTTSSGTYALLTILTLFVKETFDQWIMTKIGETDYQIDTTNTYISCKILSEVNKIACFSYSIILPIMSSALKNGTVPKKILAFTIFFAVSFSINTLIKTSSLGTFKKAKKNFFNISLCGDDWLTYGNSKLEEEILSNVKYEQEKRYSLIENIKGETHFEKDLYSGFGKDSNIKPTNKDTQIFSELKLPIRFYPLKGAFNGSYKGLLNECFDKKNYKACSKAFKNIIEKGLIIDENFDLSLLYNIKYKPYREYIYDGMEYSNTDASCKDPRDERKNYIFDPTTDNNSNVNSQLYYFRGSEEANFACDRFAISNNIKFKDAYKCCMEASQSKICIREKKDKKEIHIICDVNSNDYNNCSLVELDNKENDSLLNDYKQICKASENIKKEIDKDVSSEKKKLEENDNKNNKNNKEQENYDKLLAEINYNEITNIDTKLFCDEKGNYIGPELPKEEKIQFHIRKSDLSDTKYCVETRNLCPYNFTLKGGSEQYGNDFLDYTKKIKIIINKADGTISEDTENNDIINQNEKEKCTFFSSGNSKTEGFKTCRGQSYEPDNNNPDGGSFYDSYGKPSNFCQVDRHCVQINKLEEKQSRLLSPYLDKSCINFVGSSNNSDNYSSSVNYEKYNDTNTQHIFAPFTECFVETFKNMLLNQAGHTRCNKNEIPYSDDKKTACDSGTIFVKGDELNEENFPSPFLKMKKRLEIVSKALMVLAVMLYGFKNLIDKSGKMDTKELSQKIITMIFVSYVSLSTTWVRPMFKMTFGIYNEIFNYTMKIATKSDSKDFYDSYSYYGCYFFKNDYINNNYVNYQDRTYLAVFDTLDCKLSFYLGSFNKSIKEPPILSLILASIFSFGLIIILVFPLFAIFLALILFMMKIAYYFIISSLYCVILLFFTPIIVPMMLFDKTKSMFQKWLNEITKSLFSSVFLVIGTCLFFIMFDKYYVGDTKFLGNNSPIRDFYCGKICKINDNNFYFLNNSSSSLENVCTVDNKGKVIDLKSASFLCILKDITNNNTKSTGLNILDFFIENMIKVGQLTITAARFFDLFLDMMFLLILLYLFDQFIPYASSMNKTIFGKGFDKGLVSFEGIPTMGDALKALAGFMSKIANAGSSVGKGLKNKIKENKKTDKNPDIKRNDKDNNSSGNLDEIKNAKREDKDNKQNGLDELTNSKDGIKEKGSSLDEMRNSKNENKGLDKMENADTSFQGDANNKSDISENSAGKQEASNDDKKPETNIDPKLENVERSESNGFGDQEKQNNTNEVGKSPEEVVQGTNGNVQSEEDGKSENIEQKNPPEEDKQNASESEGGEKVEQGEKMSGDSEQKAPQDEDKKEDAQKDVEQQKEDTQEQTKQEPEGGTTESKLEQNGAGVEEPISNVGQATPENKGEEK